MKIIFVYTPGRYEPVGDKIVSALQKIFPAIDTLLFDPALAEKILDNSYAGLKEQLIKVREDNMSLSEADRTELLKVFDTMLKTERDVLIVDGLIHNEDDYHAWRKLFAGQCIFGYFDALHKPNIDLESVAMCYRVKDDKLVGFASFDSLIEATRLSLDAMGVRHLAEVA